MAAAEAQNASARSDHSRRLAAFGLGASRRSGTDTAAAHTASARRSVVLAAPGGTAPVATAYCAAQSAGSEEASVLGGLGRANERGRLPARSSSYTAVVAGAAAAEARPYLGRKLRMPSSRPRPSHPSLLYLSLATSSASLLGSASQR